MIEICKNVILENYANFKGRARRNEYWMFCLATVVVYIPLGILSLIPGIGIVFSILSGVFILAILVPGIAVAVRRMQDQDKEWWNIFIPFYNIYLLCQDGTVGPNQYGPDPKNRLEDLKEIGKDLN